MPRSDRGARREQTSPEDRDRLRDLQTIPNIGPAMASALLRLGVREPGDLLGRDPDDLYDEMTRVDGIRPDPCVWDVFAAAVHFVETGQSVPWWHFTPTRKAREARAGRGH